GTALGLLVDEKLRSLAGDGREIAKHDEVGAVRARLGILVLERDDGMQSKRHQSSFQARRMASRMKPTPICRPSIHQNACGWADSGMCSKFIPHMPLMTTKGMLIVATTDSPLVTVP